MSSLPALNRRRLLLGLAAASSAGAAIALSGAAVIAAVENSNLVGLGNDLPALEASYLSALAAKRDTYRRVMAEWPAAPDLLLRNTYSRTMVEEDVKGAAIDRDGKVWSLLSLEEVQASVASLRDALGKHRKSATVAVFRVAGFTGSGPGTDWRQVLAECEARLKAAEAYYGKTAELRAMGGYEAARQAEEAARKALLAHVAAIMAQAPTTMAGVVIQAQALAAFGKVETFYRVCANESWPWAATFAANVLRIGEEVPAKQA